MALIVSTANPCDALHRSVGSKVKCGRILIECITAAPSSLLLLHHTLLQDVCSVVIGIWLCLSLPYAKRLFRNQV